MHKIFGPYKMSKENINAVYPLSAFLLKELELEITKDKIQALFTHLNLPFDSKIAELFCLSNEKTEEYYDSVTSAPVSAAPVSVESAGEKKEEAAPKEEPAPADDFDVFGDDDLFG